MNLWKYLAILLDKPKVTFQSDTTLNPATSLLDSEGSLDLQHGCLEITDNVYSRKPDLWDKLLAETDWGLYTEGSSFKKNGQWQPEYVLITIYKTTEAQALALGTSAQKADLIALTNVLEWPQGKNVNIYIDSKYAFIIVHAHGAIWKTKQGSFLQGICISNIQKC